MIAEERTLFIKKGTKVSGSQGTTVTARVIENGFNGDMLADRAVLFVHGVVTGGSTNAVTVTIKGANAVASGKGPDDWQLSGAKVVASYANLTADKNGMIYCGKFPRGLYRYLTIEIEKENAASIASLYAGITFDVAPTEFKDSWRDDRTVYTSEKTNAEHFL